MSKQPRDLIVVGASAGGVEALRTFAAGLPADLAAAVLVVLHLPAGGTSALAAILSRSGPLRAVSAHAGNPLTHGQIQVAPPDHHLLVRDGTVALSRGPTENGHRPSINALFRSAAMAAGPAVTGVLLSGALDDGVAGLVSIASRGGMAMVQDPGEALYPSMPEHALRNLDPDYVLPATDMGAVLAKVAQEGVDIAVAPPPSRLLSMENEITMNLEAGHPTEQEPGRLGVMSGLTCPDCDGTLVEMEPARFRCRVGHAWTADALLEAQTSAWERALWAAVRTLDEKVSLGRRMADFARQRGSDRLSTRYLHDVEEASAAADVLRRYLTEGVAKRHREVSR
jgi:two-component system chemotaxis response regulator CheB